jgi:pimeloyl-ACP methyl ester carboxylesterase
VSQHDVSGVDREFVGLPSPIVGRAGAGGHPCQGVYHRPAGRRPATAFIATHYNVDFSEHYLADHMASRGFGFLGWNTRFRGAEAYFLLDHALAEIGVGVRWLREQAGVERVVLLGNSGGGSLMAAYQSQAVEPNVRPAPGLRLVDAALDLPPGDLYVSLAAHRGRPDVLTEWMDPSVVTEGDPVATDPELDMYDPTNGPPYPAEFVARYRAAQQARNRRISDWARAELDRADAAAAGVRDQLFTLVRTWADLRFVDPTIDPSDRPTPACYLGDPAAANRGVFGIGVLNTLRTWLSMWSLDDSQCRAEPHLARVTLPALVVEASADSGVFPSDTAAMYAALASSDKHVVTVTGDHYFREPDGARSEVADRLAGWLEERGSG